VWPDPTEADEVRLDVFERTVGLEILGDRILHVSYMPAVDLVYFTLFDAGGEAVAEAEVPFRLQVLASSVARLAVVREINGWELIIYDVRER
jgi:hypothetical protein